MGITSDLASLVHGKQDDHKGGYQDEDRKDDKNAKNEDDNRKDGDRKDDKNAKNEDDNRKDDKHGKKEEDDDRGGGKHGKREDEDREDHDRYADHNKKHFDKNITGTKGDDTLEGGRGDDFLNGRKGDDKLIGNEGNDTLIGGKGDDKLIGGRGEDTIVFSGVTKSSNGFDKILGFESGEDTLQFSLKDVNDAIEGSKNDIKVKDDGSLNPKNFASNEDGDAKDKDDYFVYNEDTGVLSFDADGKGGHDATALAKLVGAPELEASDIFLV